LKPEARRIYPPRLDVASPRVISLQQRARVVEAPSFESLNHRPFADLNAPSALTASGPLLGPSRSRPAAKTGWIGRK
jgi:hypothetical protein